MHAAGQFPNLAICPIRKSDQFKLFGDACRALILVETGKFKPQADIVGHAAPGQQRELLKHHGNQPGTGRTQRFLVGSANIERFISDIDANVSAGDRIQPVDGAQQSGLARAGKTHEHDDFAFRDIQRTIVDAENLAGSGLNFGPVEAIIGQRQCFAGPRAEYDRTIVDFNDGVHRPSSLSERNMRSRMIATTTMTRPASKPSAVLTELSARTTGTPSPSAPTRAAITTIESDNMIVCVSPAMICGIA